MIDRLGHRLSGLESQPRPALVVVADRITGSILDAGCGTGENAHFFAGRGHKVTGIDHIKGA